MALDQPRSVFAASAWLKVSSLLSWYLGNFLPVMTRRSTRPSATPNGLVFPLHAESFKAMPFGGRVVMPSINGSQHGACSDARMCFKTVMPCQSELSCLSVQTVQMNCSKLLTLQHLLWASVRIFFSPAALMFQEYGESDAMKWSILYRYRFTLARPRYRRSRASESEYENCADRAAYGECAAAALWRDRANLFLISRMSWSGWVTR
jgi:hypothetical protein